MYEWSTAVLSHSAGNTAATGDSFPHLATCFVISERSRVPRRSQPARTAEPSSRGPRRVTDTWLTTSASREGSYRQIFHDRNSIHITYLLGGARILGRVLGLGLDGLWCKSLSCYISIFNGASFYNIPFRFHFQVNFVRDSRSASPPRQSLAPVSWTV